MRMNDHKMWTSDLQLRATWESLLIDYLNEVSGTGFRESAL